MRCMRDTPIVRRPQTVQQVPRRHHLVVLRILLEAEKEAEALRQEAEAVLTALGLPLTAAPSAVAVQAEHPAHAGWLPRIRAMRRGLPWPPSFDAGPAT